MGKTLYTLILLLAICACTNSKSGEEEKASRLLHDARLLMDEGNYTAARDSVLIMRKRYPTAFEARAEGIIVIDSIELLAAQDTLAIMDSILQAEEDSLSQLEAEKRRGHNAEYYSKRTEVFHLKQRVDELGAKVKFYIRKIEIDTQAKEQDRS